MKNERTRDIKDAIKAFDLSSWKAKFASYRNGEGWGWRKAGLGSSSGDAELHLDMSLMCLLDIYVEMPSKQWDKEV